jgi:hypothetical protein
MMEYLLAGAGVLAIASGYALSESMVRDSSAQEMRILLQTSDTGWLLSSGWGAEEFPEFFGADWKGNDRQFYAKLSRRMKGARYGSSRRLLRNLIRIQDERQAAKADMGTREDGASLRTAAVLAGCRGNDDFSGLLAQFLEKRHLERSTGWK